MTVKVVEVMASGGEIQETAIGDQGTRLDLQLLDQVSNKSWSLKTLNEILEV